MKEPREVYTHERGPYGAHDWLPDWPSCFAWLNEKLKAGETVRVFVPLIGERECPVVWWERPRGHYLPFCDQPGVLFNGEVHILNMLRKVDAELELITL